MLAEVTDFENVISSIETLGYSYGGEWNIPGKKGFNKEEKPI